MSVSALEVADRRPLDRSALTRTSLHRLEVSDNVEERARLRDDVVVANMGVARSIAHRYRGRGVRDEDLEQVAYLGLTKAVDGFDLTYGRDFLTYAVPTITGELKRYFRDGCWVVRPPRRIQELQGRISVCRDSLSQRLGRSPRPGEIAQAMDEDVANIVEALASEGCFTPTSLDSPLSDDGSATLCELLGEEDPALTRTEVHLMLKPLLEQLKVRDRKIIGRRFFDEWTQEQIGQELGITQMQVSRLLSRIIAQLHERIDERTPAPLSA